MNAEHKAAVKGIISAHKELLEIDKDCEYAKGTLAGVHDAAEERKLYRQ